MSQLNSTTVLDLIMAATLVWCCVNLLLAVIKLKQNYMLVPNRFLYPASCKPEKCKDVAGFVAFICPRILIFAVLGLLISLLLVCILLFGLFDGLPGWVTRWLPVGLFLVLFVWYGIFINKAARRYW